MNNCNWKRYENIHKNKKNQKNNNFDFLMSDLISTDPSVWGPGMWLTLHILAFESTSLLRAKLFFPTLISIVSKLPCKQCRTHALEFINKNDYKPYLNMKTSNNKHVGPFRYICKLHNNTNILTGKDEIHWMDSYKEYSNISNICDGQCGDNLSTEIKLSGFNSNAEILNKFTKVQLPMINEINKTKNVMNKTNRAHAAHAANDANARFFEIKKNILDTLEDKPEVIFINTKNDHRHNSKIRFK